MKQNQLKINALKVKLMLLYKLLHKDQLQKIMIWEFKKFKDILWKI